MGVFSTKSDSSEVHTGIRLALNFDNAGGLTGDLIELSMVKNSEVDLRAQAVFCGPRSLIHFGTSAERMRVNIQAISGDAHTNIETPVRSILTGVGRDLNSETGTGFIVKNAVACNFEGMSNDQPVRVNGDFSLT